MYSHYFGLSQDPFCIAPDPHYLFMSERHREALAHLLYGVTGAAGGTGGGFVLLTGDIGTGKTTICRCFLEQIPAGCHVGYIFNPKLTVTELLQSVCEEFHIPVATASAMPPSVKHYIDALNAFLLQSHAAGHSSVLIIDEAQNLSAKVLEQLRLLTNLETSERKLLQIVLIGQPELRAMLARPELEQLAQRVIARFHLDALSEAESVQYIAHRLAVAGHSGPLPFDRSALQRIHRCARGVPRCINLLCGRALLGAWANGLQRVTRPMVDKAAAEVFGAEAAPAPSARLRTTGYVLGSLALLAGIGLAGFLMLSPAQKAVLSLQPKASALPAAQAGASSPVMPGARQKAVPALQATAPAAPVSQPGASLIRVEPPALSRVEEIETLLPLLPGDINAAWRALAPTWKLPPSDADPCQAASAQQLQCYRTDRLTMPLLRQLGRPAILTLRTGNGPPVYAVLMGLTDQTATLQVAGSLHAVRLVSLVRLWRGDFATYWRPPPGYNAGLRGGSTGLRGGSTGPVIERLAGQLALLDGGPAAAPVLDAALRGRLRAFQRAYGLPPNGQAGPMTFMQLDSATDVNEPRLQTTLR